MSSDYVRALLRPVFRKPFRGSDSPEKRFAPTPEPVNDAGIVPSAILADRGYDAESSHVDAGRIPGDDVVTMIPVRATKHPESARSGGRTDPGGQYRRRVYRGFDQGPV